MGDSPRQPDPAHFVGLMVRHEAVLRRWVLPLLASADDAQDVIQDAALSLWAHFEEYDPGRPFLPWAKPFVRYAALAFLRKKRRYSFLSVELAEQLIADEPDEPDGPDDEAEMDALRQCLAALPAADRRLLDARYAEPAVTVQAVAARSGESPHVLYKMARVRRRLYACVTARLAALERTRPRVG